MSAAAILARLTAAGCRVTLRPDGRVSLRPPPPPDLLAEARQHRDELARLVAATTYAGAETPSAEAAPAAQAPPRPRLTRAGAMPGEPPVPIVDPEATRILIILELAGAAPRLGPDGRLTLDHPQRVSDDMRAAAPLHQDDIEAILEYRALLERRFPVFAEPPQRPINGDTDAI